MNSAQQQDSGVGIDAAPLPSSWPEARPRLVETVDRDGRRGPAIPILQAHRVGTAHRAVSILVWNPTRSRMLITRRAASKTTWPGFWSNAVCSHPRPQESYAAAARRRLFEELRIRAAVVPAFTLYYGPVRCPVSGVFEHEFDHVFHGRLVEETPIDFDPAEISETRWASREELAELRRAGVITPWFAMILDRVRWTG